MPVSYKFVDRGPLIKATMKNRVHLFGQYMSKEIQKNGYPITPRLAGDLSTQITTGTIGSRATITWTMPYAQYQERGMRADGTHVIQNYTTPGTGPHFAYNSVITSWRQFGNIWYRTAKAIPA